MTCTYSISDWSSDLGVSWTSMVCWGGSVGDWTGDFGDGWATVGEGSSGSVGNWSSSSVRWSSIADWTSSVLFANYNGVS
jgi:hypothetical protein